MNINSNKANHADRNRDEADRLKQEREQHLEMIDMQKKSNELKA